VAYSADIAYILYIVFAFLSWSQLGLAALFSLGMMLIVLFDPSLAASLFVALWDRALWLLPCLFLGIVVHESGHLIAGKIVGFQTFLFCVGPLDARRRDGGWRIRVTVSKMSASGMIISAPVSLENLSANLLFGIAGGPAASLLFGLICLWALLTRISHRLLAKGRPSWHN
jgi:hypothetical protein